MLRGNEDISLIIRVSFLLDTLYIKSKAQFHLGIRSYLYQFLCYNVLGFSFDLEINSQGKRNKSW